MNMPFMNAFGSNVLDAITHDDLVAAHKAGSVTIVDVREKPEYAGGHIKGAINVPLSSFDVDRVPQGKPVIVYCASGARSAMAQQMLRQAGFKDVRNYKPGIGVWRLQGGAMA